MKTLRLPAGALLLFCIFTFSACAEQMKKADIYIYKQNDTSKKPQAVLSAELAITQKEQQRGLMDRKTIPDGTGMLFVFDHDQKLHFWMKNTPAALSIAYIDSKGIIKEIYDMTPFSMETISSARSVRYALEVPQGWFAAHGITEGDSILIPQEGF